ncbi:MAG: hypothetical protein QW423_03180 [Candidatus Aenigmatarchaeota archaeon]
MKVKISIFIPIATIALIAAVSYFLFLPKSSHMNDCGKPLEGFDVLFVYLKDCPHCKNDIERMKKLNISERFYMIDAVDKKCEDVVENYKDYIIYHKNSNYITAPSGIFTPTKVCLYNNKTHIGEQNEKDLIEFYENCVGVKP